MLNLYNAFNLIWHKLRFIIVFSTARSLLRKTDTTSIPLDVMTGEPWYDSLLDSMD